MRKNAVIYRKQLCWDCRKSDASSDCPWANNFKPVPGWNATPVIRTFLNTTTVKGKVVRFRKELTHTFEIIDCPLFEKDDRK